MSGVIRCATADDIDAIQRCAREAYAVYVERMGREPAPMLADFAEQVTRGVVHVMEEAGAVTGFVVYYPRDGHMHLENVAVSVGSRGEGIGALLIEHVEAEARLQKLPSVELYTNEKMTENIPYYSARGYVEVGRWEEDGFNRIFFSKAL